MALLSNACTLSVSPSSTAPDPAEAAIVVIVRARSDRDPIHGALVRYRSNAWYTDVAGQSVIPVVPGFDATIAVSASGYGAMSASGVVGDGERWTFYLDAVGDF